LIEALAACFGTRGAFDFVEALTGFFVTFGELDFFDFFSLIALLRFSASIGLLR
jgi:hypothetical protein